MRREVPFSESWFEPMPMLSPLDGGIIGGVDVAVVHDRRCPRN